MTGLLVNPDLSGALLTQVRWVDVFSLFFFLVSQPFFVVTLRRPLVCPPGDIYSTSAAKKNIQLLGDIHVEVDPHVKSLRDKKNVHPLARSVHACGVCTICRLSLPLVQAACGQCLNKRTPVCRSCPPPSAAKGSLEACCGGEVHHLFSVFFFSSIWELKTSPKNRFEGKVKLL